MDATGNALTIGPISSFESINTRYFFHAAAGHGVDRVASSEVLVYVLRGSMIFLDLPVNIRVEPNELLLLHGPVDEDISFDYSDDSEWYFVQFCGPNKNALPPYLDGEAFLHVRAARPERLTALLRHCLDIEEQRPYSDFVAAHFIQLVVEEINLSRPENGNSFDGQGVFEVITSRVDAYIAAHYHEPISTVDIAREIRYNPEYLERAYRHVRQLSIREAILERRVREARAQLLLQKTRSVSDIAVTCGFNDLSYFRRVFKKMTNMTPHRYRSTRRSARESLSPGSNPVVTSRIPAPHDSEKRLRKARSKVSPFDVCPVVTALNAGFFVSSGYGTHARRTIDSYELIFVTEGCLELFEEQASYHIRKNQALLLAPGRVHGGLSPFEPDLNFYWIHFRVPDPMRAGSVMRVPKTAQVADPELLTELFCMFISDQESQTLSKECAANLVALMLSVIGEASDTGGQRNPRGKPNDLAKAIEKFIDENYDKPISTAAIAKELQFNPDYLERVHREYGGTSIVRSLHERRIRAAREHLRNRTTKNINEIAFACGYNDSGYFRRVFKRETGLTPKQYRSMFVQTHINTH